MADQTGQTRGFDVMEQVGRPSLRVTSGERHSVDDRPLASSSAIRPSFPSPIAR